MRILSGITSSGECHLGNYFGAMAQHIELQDQGEGIYFIADFHSMTSVRDGALRRRLVDDVALVGPEGRIRERLQAWKEAGRKGHVGSMLIGGGQPELFKILAEEVL